MSAEEPRIDIVLLAAVADNGIIGRDNGLPFRQSSDLKRFKQLSIGKPLPGRTNIVVTRDPSFNAVGVVTAMNLDAAMTVARGDALRRGADAVVVIGGTDIFKQTMPLADRLEITHVHARPEGDVSFPPIEETHWRATDRSDHPAGPQDEASFSYVTYLRT